MHRSIGWTWTVVVGLAVAGANSGCGSDKKSVVPDDSPFDHNEDPNFTYENGLTRPERNSFYTLPEGSELFPLDWFLLMEDGKTGKPFIDNLSRFGLIDGSLDKKVDPVNYEALQKLNPHNLPIGVTSHTPLDTGFEMVGINCAACHVTEVSYNGTAFLVDGAPNQFDIRQFYNDMISSAEVTAKSPLRLAKLLLGWSSTSTSLPERMLSSLTRLGSADVSDFESSVANDRDGVVEHIQSIEKHLLGESSEAPKDGATSLLRDEIGQVHDEEKARFYAGLQAAGKNSNDYLQSVLHGGSIPADDTPSVSSSVESLKSLNLKGDENAQEVVGKPSVLVGWFAHFRERIHLFYARLEFLKSVANSNVGGTEPLAGRIDAFGYARNFLFGSKYGYEKNTAPVSYPHLWGFEKTAWLHWNANTNSVLERNIGQALGVGAIVDSNFDTTVEVAHTHVLETTAYKILPPSWPSIFPAIRHELASKGKVLYTRECAGCHDQKNVTKQGLNDYPRYTMSEIGTDPNQAVNFNKVLGSDLPANQQAPFASTLDSTLTGIKTKFYEKNKIPEATQKKWEAHRSPVKWRSVWPAEGVPEGVPKYTLRPLAGVWAMAPFLHNNSVPTLHDLLLPQDQRPVRFWVGSRQYNPVKMGYLSSEGEDELDTTLDGNHNTGHEYGTSLSEDERLALLEYLKTM